MLPKHFARLTGSIFRCVERSVDVDYVDHFGMLTMLNTPEYASSMGCETSTQFSLEDFAVGYYVLLLLKIVTFKMTPLFSIKKDIMLK